MMQTMKPMNLKGNGILGKKVEFVTATLRTKSDAARASAKGMIEKDGVIMFSGGRHRVWLLLFRHLLRKWVLFLWQV